ncbi:MAG: SUMF1/EgtB/PvdO family nonheme iron enzyme [Elusimicrobia bacterium]|nr:SUMF1/EgtB/PvdO family nonheme iron enzyme [Elusimicrobiota bacterium]
MADSFDCPWCKQKGIDVGALICWRCGKPVAAGTCLDSKCGQENRAQAKFCGHCGSDNLIKFRRLPGGVWPPPPEKPRPEPHRPEKPKPEPPRPRPPEARVPPPTAGGLVQETRKVTEQFQAWSIKAPPKDPGVPAPPEDPPKPGESRSITPPDAPGKPGEMRPGSARGVHRSRDEIPPGIRSESAPQPEAEHGGCFQFITTVLVRTVFFLLASGVLYFGKTLLSPGERVAGTAPSTTPASSSSSALPSKGGAGRAGMRWVTIPGGEFQMGAKDVYRARPVHRVRVRSFQIAKTEVIVAQYKACVDAGACTPPDDGGSCNWGKTGRERYPVNCLDWSQAKAFSEWVGGRLPSEAEWEYAARGAGKPRSFPWGEEAATCERAVIAEGGNGCGRDGAWPVCSRAADVSEQGLCDLAGNVSEWVQDLSHETYEGAPKDGGAWEVAGVAQRILRGGAWFFGAPFARVANRQELEPSIRSAAVGLRPAKDL